MLQGCSRVNEGVIHGEVNLLLDGVFNVKFSFFISDRFVLGLVVLGCVAFMAMEVSRVVVVGSPDDDGGVDGVGEGTVQASWLLVDACILFGFRSFELDLDDGMRREAV